MTKQTLPRNPSEYHTIMATRTLIIKAHRQLATLTPSCVVTTLGGYGAIADDKNATKHASRTHLVDIYDGYEDTVDVTTSSSELDDAPTIDDLINGEARTLDDFALTMARAAHQHGDLNVSIILETNGNAAANVRLYLWQDINDITRHGLVTYTLDTSSAERTNVEVELGDNITYDAAASQQHSRYVFRTVDAPITGYMRATSSMLFAELLSSRAGIMLDMLAFHLTKGAAASA